MARLSFHTNILQLVYVSTPLPLDLHFLKARLASNQVVKDKMVVISIPGELTGIESRNGSATIFAVAWSTTNLTQHPLIPR